ncbi:RNA polymerase III RPC4-domain-containing protein [Russula compacta]|nr:RNA polymerase III RPC4-domain-containing protein [Russula compacta]
MTASGPFAMGPSQAGSSTWHSGPRVSAMSTASSRGPTDAAAAAALGANLTGTTAPALKKERAERRVQVDQDAEVYSDPDEGVEIVDMRSVHAMDWMAPESLKVKRAHEKTKKVVKAATEDEGGRCRRRSKGKQATMAMDALPAVDDAGDVNLANALDLSESEEEEDMEDIIDDFSRDREDQGLQQERLYFFQFPAPFPTFVSQSPTRSDPGRGDNAAPASEGKHVSFSADTKPPSAVPEDVDKESPSAHVDGVIGQLEIYQSGAVKMRLANGILLDVTAAMQPSFLQQAVHVDRASKDLRVLGEVSRRFVVTPDIDSLLVAMTQADEAAAAAKCETDGLVSMDTT